MPASFMIRFMMIRPFLYRSCQKLFQCALTDTAIKDPSFHKVCMSPAAGFNFSNVFPKPLPPLVANRMIFLSLKSYALRKLVMILGASYHQIGKPKKMTS